MFFALFGFIFLSTQYLQFVLGYTPFQAGIRTLPFAAAMMLLAPSSSRFVQALGTKRVVVVGALSFATGLVVASTATVASGYTPLMIAMVLMGAGMGLAVAPATESIMSSLPPDRAGVGSAVNDTTREVGGALGVAIVEHFRRAGARVVIRTQDEAVGSGGRDGEIIAGHGIGHGAIAR